MIPQYESADILLTRGSGWLSQAIRFFTRRIGESRTQVNHVGLFVLHGPYIVEALHRVEFSRLYDAYADPDQSFAVFRPKNLTPKQKQEVAAYAHQQVGKHYGYLKIGLHMLDWALQGAYVFRRLGRMDDYPICSWLVAQAYARQGFTFGVEPGAATPDDIWDFVTTNADKYECVRELAPLTDEERYIAT